MNCSPRIWCAAAIAALLAVSCSTSQTRQEKQRFEGIRTSYHSLLSAGKPGWVCITYPESRAMLSPAKRDEFDTLRRVLRDLRIPHETARYSDTLMDFVGEIDGKPHQTFHLSERDAARCKDGTIYYIHLGGSERVKAFHHPLARKNDIYVRYVYDPLDRPASS